MEQIKEAVYLINDERYLHLRENGAGVGFATYNKVTGEPLESGQISEKNLPPDGRNMMAAARNWYLFVLSEDERKVKMCIRDSIQSVDQNRAIKTVKRTITELDRSKIEEQKKAIRAGYDIDIIPSDLATYGRDRCV